MHSYRFNQCSCSDKQYDIVVLLVAFIPDFLKTNTGAKVIVICSPSHEKWKDSLETGAVVLAFLVELEISAVAVSEAVQKIAAYQKEYRKCSSCVITC